MRIELIKLEREIKVLATINLIPKILKIPARKYNGSGAMYIPKSF